MGHSPDRPGMTEELIYSYGMNARLFDRHIFGILMKFTAHGEAGLPACASGRSSPREARHRLTIDGTCYGSVT